MNTYTVTISEVWPHFMENVKPAIWKGLDKRQRTRITNANRDYHGKRKRKDGTVEKLHPQRVKSILLDFAPDVYEFVESVEIKTAAL